MELNRLEKKDFNLDLLKIEKEELKADLYSANSIIRDMLDVHANCISKDKIIEKKIYQLHKSYINKDELTEAAKFNNQFVVAFTGILDELLEDLLEGGTGTICIDEVNRHIDYINC